MAYTSLRTAQDRRGPIALIAIGALVVLLLVGGGVWWVLGRGDAPTPSPQPGGTDQSASTSVCGLPDGSQTVEKEPPRGVVWTVPAYQAVPTKKSIGPGRTANGIHSCFAHNPDGALFASIYFFADLDAAEADQPALVRERVVMDARGRKLAQTLAATPVPSSKGVAQLAGYRVADYSPTGASVDLVFEVVEGPKQGGLVMTPSLVRWENGDWKLLINDRQEQVQVTSLDGFTKWSHS